MRWDKELPQCIRKLRNQHAHYDQTMRILLEPITTEVELAEMMTDPGSSQLWKDKEMAGKLQDRLQEAYHAYQGTIADIERITKQIASRLDLDRADEVRTITAHEGHHCRRASRFVPMTFLPCIRLHYCS
jgi:hypothetical protein